MTTCCFYTLPNTWESQIIEKLEAALAEVLAMDEEFRFYFYGCDVVQWHGHTQVCEARQAHPEKKITLVHLVRRRDKPGDLFAEADFDEVEVGPPVPWHQGERAWRRAAEEQLLARCDVAFCYRYDDFYEADAPKPARIPAMLRGVRKDLTTPQGYERARRAIQRLPRFLRDVYVRRLAGVPVEACARELGLSPRQVRLRAEAVSLWFRTFSHPFNVLERPDFLSCR